MLSQEKSVFFVTVNLRAVLRETWAERRGTLSTMLHLSHITNVLSCEESAGKWKRLLSSCQRRWTMKSLFWPCKIKLNRWEQEATYTSAGGKRNLRTCSHELLSLRRFGWHWQTSTSTASLLTGRRRFVSPLTSAATRTTTPSASRSSRWSQQYCYVGGGLGMRWMCVYM